jgi:Bacterial archaeo-eukaryotic release factor family 10
MLAREGLISLYRDHRDQKVLSIYLDAEEHDPAKRRAWRRTLDHITDAAAAEVPPDERDAFDRSLAHLRTELRRYDAFLPDAGWAGFATPSRLLYAETLPVEMPDLARWEQGLRVAPYVRALRETTPVVTVLVDSRQAKMFRQRNGSFEELDPVHADTFFGDLSDVNMSKRATTRTGVRGETETDAAQRFEEVGAARLLKHLSESVAEMAGPDGIIVVGGTSEMTAALLQRLPKSLQRRTTEHPSISFWTSTADLRRAASEAASHVIASRQKDLLDQVVENAGAGNRACLGRETTDRALTERRVEVLLLSRKLADADPEYADRCVGAAFEQDADVEELVGTVADRLDSAAHGIGARLRY